MLRSQAREAQGLRNMQPPPPEEGKGLRLSGWGGEVFPAVGPTEATPEMEMAEVAGARAQEGSRGLVGGKGVASSEAFGPSPGAVGTGPAAGRTQGRICISEVEGPASRRWGCTGLSGRSPELAGGPGSGPLPATSQRGEAGGSSGPWREAGNGLWRRLRPPLLPPPVHSSTPGGPEGGPQS